MGTAGDVRTAGYLASDIQRDVLAVIERSDRSAQDFFVRSPFVIDCRSDREGFSTQLTASQRQSIVAKWAEMGEVYACALARPANAYCVAQVERWYRALDRETVDRVGKFLRDWRLEGGRRPDQRIKPEGSDAWGVEVILPESGIRCICDSSVMMRFA